ncbi:nitroreductase family protein [Crossiella sp. CA-258035]|uniref:nitroreductase family protein n=1 Tax=Crossiella sp. CA-258035 TaxID=2981138 RepID=UPI0024BBFDCB|nr:nitroreductase family protein [Crossiella sp. CA-258035]WHT16402.1 nitroreductase family protein [Crossiella sp. CA-258035]
MTDLTAHEVLTTTRTVRRRLDLERPVDLELVRQALTTAVQAPSGSNAQRWHFLVITDADQRAAVGEYYRRAAEAYFATPESAGNQPDPDPNRQRTQQRVRASSEHLAQNMGRVPVLVIPAIETPDRTELPAGNQSGLWGSILPAAWSYMLAARSLGLATAWTTLHLRYEREVADLLGLPPTVHQAALIPTAHYTGEGFKPAPRQPLEQVLHLNRW